MIGRLLDHANHHSISRDPHQNDDHVPDAAQQIGDANLRIIGVGFLW